MQKKINAQKTLCTLVLKAFSVGMIALSESEVNVVRAMMASKRPLKDTHVAVLRAFIERAGQQPERNPIENK
jgi:hypothetical protein